MQAWEWLFAALVHEKLGHREQARRYLDQSRQWCNSKRPTTGKPSRIGTLAGPIPAGRGQATLPRSRSIDRGEDGGTDGAYPAALRRGRTAGLVTSAVAGGSLSANVSTMKKVAPTLAGMRLLAQIAHC